MPLDPDALIGGPNIKVGLGRGRPDTDLSGVVHENGLLRRSSAASSENAALAWFATGAGVIGCRGVSVTNPLRLPQVSPVSARTSIWRNSALLGKLLPEIDSGRE
jgi:hypothetical protein